MKGQPIFAEAGDIDGAASFPQQTIDLVKRRREGSVHQM